MRACDNTSEASRGIRTCGLREEMATPHHIKPTSPFPRAPPHASRVAEARGGAGMGSSTVLVTVTVWVRGGRVRVAAYRSQYARIPKRVMWLHAKGGAGDKAGEG